MQSLFKAQGMGTSCKLIAFWTPPPGTSMRLPPTGSIADSIGQNGGLGPLPGAWMADGCGTDPRARLAQSS